MQLNNIHKITGIIEVKTGLHIGAGDTEMRIGGTDSQVIKNPLTNQPYIPGSSLKGKIRSLLEWRYQLVDGFSTGPVSVNDLSKFEHLPDQKAAAIKILKLFGTSPSQEAVSFEPLGPTRLAFWDCAIDEAWLVSIGNHSAVEVKSENHIDRIGGGGQDPRFIERVVPSAQFKFILSLKVFDGEEADLLPIVLTGLKLLELDSLGGSGSRGYGKVEFKELACDGIEKIDAQFAKIVNPFQ